MNSVLTRLVRHGYDPEKENDCSYVWKIPPQNRCIWVQSTGDCSTDSVFQYTEFMFCNFESTNAILFGFGLMLIILWLLYMFLILGTTADQFFCPSLAVIAGVMRLSDSIAGVTILAFGNGAPDIFTSIVSGSDEGIIMFTELIGAGVFVTAMIAGSVAITKPFRTNLKPLTRDVCFYMASICWISFIVNDEEVQLWEALSLICCYVLFILTVVLMQMLETREKNQKSRIPTVADPEVLRAYLVNTDTTHIPTIPKSSRGFRLRTKIDNAIAAERKKDKIGDASEETEDIEDIEHESRPKGLVKEFMYDVNPIGKEDWASANYFFKFLLIIRSPAMLLLQLFIPLVDWTVAKKGWSKLLNCFQLCVTPMMALILLGVYNASIGSVPLLPIFFVVGTVIGVIVFRLTSVNRIPKFHNVFAFLGFLVAMLTVYRVAGEVMAILQCVGHSFGLSDAMLGITFLAWGNSVGDMISNVAIARQGFPRMGYAACFGGPMFNTLLGLGLTYGIAAYNDEHRHTPMRMSDMAPGCLAFLLCSLLATIIYMNITDAVARRSYGYLMYSMYFAFILVQFLSEFEVMAPLGTDHLAVE